MLWSIQDHLSAAAEASAKSPGSSGSSVIKSSKSIGEKISESPVIGPRGIYLGHDDTVEDVQFCPSR